MQAPVSYKVKAQQLWLSGERALYWEEEKALVVSDLHFGKTGHFRKSGIAVPQSVYKEDLQRLVSLLHYFRPQQLIVVGDFFHSHANIELDWFRRWREDFSEVKITLVKGNHDILHERWYADTGIDVVEPELITGPFLFTHEPSVARPDVYIFSGHIHPGVVLRGAGRQSLRFPCFYFGPDCCILPAFSKFTGTVAVAKEPGSVTYAIADKTLIAV